VLGVVREGSVSLGDLVGTPWRVSQRDGGGVDCCNDGIDRGSLRLVEPGAHRLVLI
jgi:hypothetical protein